jgi:thiol-disulfide isomerase/thioredoxin
MKKLFTVFSVLVLVVVLCSGCGCKNEKVSLQIGDMNVTTYIDVSMGELKSKIKNKDNFILFVYKDDCEGCRFFKPILNNVIAEKHIIIYGIRYNDIERKHELKSLQWTPSIVIYKSGKAILMTDPDENESYFNSNKGFASLLDKYTYMPTLYYINKGQLDNKIANKENFIIYYSRSGCSDCGYLNRNYLKKYLNSNTGTKHFYIIETNVEGIRYNNGEYDSSVWQAFKDEYGLSNLNNPLGHGVGYVPTFQYYENGEIKDMMIYFNDYLETFQNEDGESFVKIDNSYYDDNPYIGQTIAGAEYKKKLAPFYNEKVKSFLDVNLVKID